MSKKRLLIRIDFASNFSKGSFISFSFRTIEQKQWYGIYWC